MRKNRGTEGRIDLETASRILRTVSTQESFLFFTGINQYTGEFAQNLEDFYSELSNVPLESLDFHFERGDFEKWIREMLGDAYLADRINRVEKSIKGEKLRRRLKGMVKRRLNQLKNTREKSLKS